jgi:hypothetical protein
MRPSRHHHPQATTDPRAVVSWIASTSWQSSAVGAWMIAARSNERRPAHGSMPGAEAQPRRSSCFVGSVEIQR